MKQHANAKAAGGSGVVAVLVVWAAGYFGLDMPAEVGAAIASTLAALVLVVGRNGVSGVARILWRGR